MLQNSTIMKWIWFHIKAALQKKQCCHYLAQCSFILVNTVKLIILLNITCLQLSKPKATVHGEEPKIHQVTKTGLNEQNTVQAASQVRLMHWYYSKILHPAPSAWSVRVTMEKEICWQTGRSLQRACEVAALVPGFTNGLLIEPKAALWCFPCSLQGDSVWLIALTPLPVRFFSFLLRIEAVIAVTLLAHLPAQLDTARFAIDNAERIL